MTTSPITDIQPGNLDGLVASYVESYAFDADDCHHVPDENERALLTDALHGFIAQHCARLTSTTPTLGDMVVVPRDVVLEAIRDRRDNGGGSASYQQACNHIIEAVSILSAAPASPIPTSVANEKEREAQHVALFSKEAMQDAARETNRLCHELDITNADHIVLWLEHQLDGATGPLAYIACRILDAHEKALSDTLVERQDIIAEVIELARRDIAREQTDFLGRMSQALCTYEGIFDQYPDGDLPDDERDEANDQISALAGLALAQLVLLRHPCDGTDPAAALSPALDNTAVEGQHGLGPNATVIEDEADGFDPIAMLVGPGNVYLQQGASQIFAGLKQAEAIRAALTVQTEKAR